METNRKASPFSENGRGLHKFEQNKNTENNGLLKGLERDFNSRHKPKNKFPIEVLPMFYRDLISELESSLGLSLDYTAASLFFIVSVAIGNKIKLKHKTGWLEGANLYSIIIGKPGDGKSHALSFMQKPIQKIEKELYEEYQMLVTEYERETESGNQLPKPKLKQYLINDSTSEAVLKNHSINEKGVGILVDEIRAFFNGLNKYRGGNDEELYLSAFSGKPIKVTRTTKETVRIDDSHISIVGSIQPKMLGRAFKGQKMNNGFIDRFLFFWPEKCVRIKWNSNEIDHAILDQYNERIKDIYHYTEKLEKPNILKFEPRVRKFLHSWQNMNQDEFEFEHERGTIVKLEQYILRFCILLHVLRNFSVDGLPPEIEYDVVKDAIKLYDYFKENAMRVHEQMNSNYYDELNEIQKKLFQLLPEQFKTGDGVKIALENDLMSERGFKNFIKDKGLFRKVSYGVNEKRIF